ncbi:carbohydrate kinase family protein [Halapricum sp. CBA1109]|uniref:carbohydrate kinase family protein n=1 Tax=Halapricum sp. CBA1109 TaxID=2668068 RepID=UPI0012F86AC3|nr:PfkB family carbohydrate kinase [Halapricum sp. CBA1109]MUV89720.1 carbohydrate kinase family protein [Halapricum sp. CBA1109]
MDVFVAGGCSWDAIVYLDQFPDGPGTVFARDFRETVGSSGTGKALNLGRLGVGTRFHAMVGEDRFGTAIRERLDTEPITTAFDLDPAGTERHVNLMDDAGDRISIFTVPPTQEPDIDYGRLETWVAAADALVVSPVNYTRPLVETAAAVGTPVWADVHEYDGEDDYFETFVAGADALFLSDEAIGDYEAFMREQIAAGKRLVVCTHGDAGASAMTPDGELVTVDAVDAEVVDTNGAGDAFFAGYLYGYRQGESVETCLRLGAIAGGLAVESRELAHPELSSERLAAEYERRYDDARKSAR